MSQHDPDHRGAPSAGSDTDLDDLVTHLGRLAREFAKQPDHAATISSVLGAALDDVPGAQHASISVTRDRHVRTVDATSDLARSIDQHQYDTGEGPCLDTLFEHVTVRTAELEGDERWPRFARAAVADGVHSMLSVQLFTVGRDLGALNLFSAERESFTDESERVALALAAHAAVAVSAAEQIEGLQTALASRDLIGQAKGVLMQRHGVDADTAFAVLVRYSRTSNRKLVQVAQDVVDRRSAT